MSNLCVPDEIQAIRSELYVAGVASAALLERVEGLVRRFPESPELWILRGDAMRGASLADARLSYEQALALDPGNRAAAERIAGLK